MNLGMMLAQTPDARTWGYEWGLLWVVLGVMALAMIAAAFVSNRRPIKMPSQATSRKTAPR